MKSIPSERRTRASLWLVCATLVTVSAAAQESTNPNRFGSGPLLQAEPSNTLTYSVASSSSFDDDVQGTAGQSNVTGSVQPQVGLLINRPRLQSSFHYGPSFTYSSKVDSQNSVSEAVGGEIQYSFSKHLRFSGREAFIVSSNPLDSLEAAMSLPDVGVIERPSTLFVGARVHRNTQQVGGDVVYDLSARSSVGIGGTFGNASYRTLQQNGASAADAFVSRAWSAHSFVSHRFTPRYTFGFDYTAQNFSSRSAKNSILTNSLLGFANISLSQNVHLSVFAGPEVSQIQQTPIGKSGLIPAQDISVSVGSTFAWQGKRNGMNASFVQHVSDSGGLSEGAVKAKIVSFQAVRQLTKRSNLSAFANYVSNGLLGGQKIGVVGDSYSLGVGLSRPVTRSFELRLSAFRQEFIGQTAAVFGYSGHDVVSAMLSYSFARPIGR